MSVANIWIVDDDKNIRWVLEKALQKSGHNPVTFENAYEMLNQLREEKQRLFSPTFACLKSMESR